MRRWVWVALVLGLGAGCEKPKVRDESPEADALRARCRRECGASYKSCMEGCKDDAPQVCQKRCELNHRQCMNKCDDV